MDADRVRLFVQGALAIAVLGGATFLTATGHIDGQALVALYGASLGAVGSGAVGGIRAAAPPGVLIEHTHTVNGQDRTGREETTT